MKACSMRKLTIWSMMIFVAALACPALAAVDLVTLPTREGTQLTIYNSEDITMVREHRLLTVKEGVNRIQIAYRVASFAANPKHHSGLACLRIFFHLPTLLPGKGLGR